TLSLQVRDRLVRMLPEGEPSAEQVASSLHLSLRSLQRRLAEEDSSYEQLLLLTREELARSYLQDPRHAISEIAYLLGYADASCFTRAFRRWTGMAPSVYRAGGLRDQG
ncbi:MAG: helix-turn-helix domain-containing protein, partial [Xanthomonadales bacterium]|nr:helix-turn-helix domain-containing protein [Xanthomonadales bacterium]